MEALKMDNEIMDNEIIQHNMIAPSPPYLTNYWNHAMAHGYQCREWAIAP